MYQRTPLWRCRVPHVDAAIVCVERPPRFANSDCLSWVCLPGAVVTDNCWDSFIMVVIRLARGGANKRPFYNIIVTDSRSRRDGRYIERLGFYNPMAAGAEQPLRVALDRVKHWAGVGAVLSPTVKRLVGQAELQTAAPAA